MLNTLVPASGLALSSSQPVTNAPAQANGADFAAGVRLLGVYMRRELRREIGFGDLSPIPVAFRTDPSRPHAAVGVFPYILAEDAPGYLAWTLEGLALVSEEWIAASIPARPKASKAVAADLRSRAGCRITGSVQITDDSRQVAEVRRKHSATAARVAAPYLDLGRACVLTTDNYEPQGAAILLAHETYGVTVNQIANAMGLSWQATWEALEAARSLRATHECFAVDFGLAVAAAEREMAARGLSPSAVPHLDA